MGRADSFAACIHFEPHGACGSAGLGEPRRPRLSFLRPSSLSQRHACRMKHPCRMSRNGSKRRRVA
eukprot:3596130-Pleurochrysis_carterae.AAC.2